VVPQVVYMYFGAFSTSHTGGRVTSHPSRFLLDCYDFNNKFKDIFFTYLWCASMKHGFLICPTVHWGSRYCFGLQGKGGSESKTHNLEFLSSEIGNPNCM
jgi:hypothetical protein